ncbi:hypothetical protein D3C72_977020 [compost metagenome]
MIGRLHCLKGIIHFSTLLLVWVMCFLTNLSYLNFGTMVNSGFHMERWERERPPIEQIFTMKKMLICLPQQLAGLAVMKKDKIR